MLWRHQGRWWAQQCCIICKCLCEMVGRAAEAALCPSDHEVKGRCSAVSRKRSRRYIKDLSEDSGHVCFRPGKLALTLLCYQNAESHPNSATNWAKIWSFPAHSPHRLKQKARDQETQTQILGGVRWIWLLVIQMLCENFDHEVNCNQRGEKGGSHLLQPMGWVFSAYVDGTRLQ